MSLRLGLALLLSAGLAGVTGLRACVQPESWPGVKGAPPPAQPTTPAPSVGSVSVDVERPHGAHPRILANPDRVAALRGLHDAGAPAWRRLAAQCDEAARAPIEAGYEAWDWVNAALDLALCSAVAPRPDYQHAAMQYFRAVLDDRSKVGDGGGGDDVVRHDDGYSIRTRGCFGALAYDWLHDAPEMTPELRKHAIDRFVAWTQWFSESGYNRDEPIANYYMGYFGAVAFGGIAGQGDDPRADRLLQSAQRMYASEIVPAYERKLAGGDFPEGWQYGDMVGAILALFADAETRPGAPRSPFDELPWLKESIELRTHALWPDGRHTLDTGDWSNKPAVAPTHTLQALALVLPAGEPAAAHAHALAKLASDPKGEEWHWLAALAEDPSRPSEDPRREKTSYLSRGTATITARTDWTPAGVWFALASAPSLSDHQHLDAGHFELVRGSDALVVDAGGYGSYASLSHNVIAVDDHKENDVYSPNQGTWSDTASIARHEDDGRFVYALADYASAYNPPGYPEDHPARSVSRAERETIFSRGAMASVGSESARLVVYDRVSLTRPNYRATFLLHGAGDPQLQGQTVRFAQGKSAAVATTLLPAGATPSVVAEPTNLGDGPYFANDPPEDTKSVRIEVPSKAGELERRFLHAIVVGDAKAVLPTPCRIEGEGIDGVAIDDEAYVFVRSGPQKRAEPLAYRAPAAAVRQVVASLAPHERYVVTAAADGDGCRVAVAPGAAGVYETSSAGVVVLDLAPGCGLRPPVRAPRADGGP